MSKPVSVFSYIVSMIMHLVITMFLGCRVLAQRHFFYTAIKEWNNLPVWIKNIESYSSFKYHLKSQLKHCLRSDEQNIFVYFQIIVILLHNCIVSTMCQNHVFSYHNASISQFSQILFLPCAKIMFYHNIMTVFLSFLKSCLYL